MCKNCFKCYWFEKCNEGLTDPTTARTCDDYSPLDEEEDVEEYEDDLQMREEDYADLIREQYN